MNTLVIKIFMSLASELPTIVNEIKTMAQTAESSEAVNEKIAGLIADFEKILDVVKGML